MQRVPGVQPLSRRLRVGHEASAADPSVGSVLSTRAQRAPRIDGRTFPPSEGPTRATAHDASHAASVADVVGNESAGTRSIWSPSDALSELIKQRSNASRAALSTALTTASRYSQESAVRSAPQRGSSESGTLRSDKLDRRTPAQGLTLTGWPHVSPTSSMDVHTGDSESEHDDVQRPERPATRAGASDDVETAVHADETPIEPLEECGQSTARILEPTGASAPATAPSPPTKESAASLPPLIFSSRPSASSDAVSMPRTPQDTEPLGQVHKVGERKRRRKGSRSKRALQSLEVGHFCLHDDGRGWTHGIVANKAERTTVSRSEGFFRTSVEMTYAVRVDGDYYASLASALQRAPSEPPAFARGDETLVRHRGLCLHCQIQGIRIADNRGVDKWHYVYTVTPVEIELQDHSFEAAEARLRKLPCQVSGKVNTVLFCTPACRRVGDFYEHHARSISSGPLEQPAEPLTTLGRGA